MSDQAALQGRPRPASVRMRCAPHQILAGVPGPRGCPRIQAGDVSQGRRALGGSDALERKTVVLPEFLESCLVSQEQFHILKLDPTSQMRLLWKSEPWLESTGTFLLGCGAGSGDGTAGGGTDRQLMRRRRWSMLSRDASSLLEPLQKTLVKSVFEMLWKEAGSWQKPIYLFLV